MAEEQKKTSPDPVESAVDQVSEAIGIGVAKAIRLGTKFFKKIVDSFDEESKKDQEK